MGKPRATKNGYTEWETKENLEKIREWASHGLPKADIAHNMGICRDTLYEWGKKSSAITDAIKKGKGDLEEIIESCLFKQCEEGNVTAIIFALKNLSPEKWKDRKENEITGTGKIVIAWDDGANE